MPTAHRVPGPCLLAADIGGTKTDLGVYALGSGPRAPLATGRLPSADYDGIVPLARAFLDAHGLAVDYACFDVAGPVVVAGRNSPTSRGCWRKRRSHGRSASRRCGC
jgi:glucokinase